MITLLALVAFKVLDLVALAIKNWGMTLRLMALLGLVGTILYVMAM